MNKPDYGNMTDKDFADFLKDYAAERKGDLADIINEAAARIEGKDNSSIIDDFGNAVAKKLSDGKNIYD